MKRKKILIICNHFAPDNTIAAVRVTKIAKYLFDSGYEIDVVAEKKNDEIKDEILEKDAKGINVIRVENSDVIKKILEIYKKVISPIKKKRFDNLDNRVRLNRKTGKYEFYPFQTAYPLIGSLDYLSGLLCQYDLSRIARKKLDKYEEYNYMFTSHGDLLGYFLGKYMHKNNANIPWIFDIRDSICGYKMSPRYIQWILKKLERYVWQEADCITGVSKGICDRVHEKYHSKVHCVTNGYDKNDRMDIVIDNQKKEKLIFVYTGAMYGGLQNLSPVFRNIKILIDEKVIDSTKIEFKFAGKENSYKIFESQAQKYELQRCCKNCGMLTRKDSLRLQMESDILLVSSYDYQDNVRGIITGKALEYMSANKPIIAIINGDIEHSELAEIIRSGNLGCAYEEAHSEKDSKELYEYLKAKYQEFMDKGKLEHNPNEDVVSKFDYENICNRMMKIIESTNKRG